MDVGDERQVEKAKRKSKTQQEIWNEELRTLLSHRMGRNFLWRVLSETGIYRGSFTGDPEGTIFNEGRRSIGLYLMEQIVAADDTAYLKMQREAADD